MDKALADLLAAVTRIENDGDAFMAYAKGIADQLIVFKDSPAEVERLAGLIVAKADQFRAAIPANTPNPDALRLRGQGQTQASPQPRRS